MKRLLLLAGVAAMTAAIPAAAEQGNGKGNGKGGGQAAQKAKPQKAQGQGARGPAKAQQRQMKVAQGRGNGNAERKAAQRQQRADVRRIERVRDVRIDDRRVRYVSGRDFDDYRGACPPGLARKNNGCLPPGQAKKIARGERFDADWYRGYDMPMGYRSFYSDTPDYYYRYGDNGYIYRVNRDTSLVSGLIPLLGGGFGVGQMLPAGYDLYNVPWQYRDTWYDTDDSYYRYGDNAIYQVDPESMMIENVVALMTGDRFGIGQTLPTGYDMYNVPWDYRDRYYDTPQYNYRYADGNIYQVDPQTQIIQAIISALV